MVDVAAIRQRFSAVAPFLNERGRRVFAATEARRPDMAGSQRYRARPGSRASTIGRGLKELAAPERAGSAIRRRGGGGKTAVAQDATLLSRPAGAGRAGPARGDPKSPLRWTCKSLRSWRRSCQAQGHRVSRTLVGESAATAEVTACKPIARRARATVIPTATRSSATSTRACARRWRRATGDLGRYQEEGIGRRLQERRPGMASAGRARRRSACMTS